MNQFPSKCGRCRQGPPVTMSWFDTDMICEPCSQRERAHPRYAEAREAERAALKSGDRNFPGIGKPQDL